MKKAQIEMVGLLVIVILVSIVIFFALSFRLSADETQTPVREEFKDIQALSNFGSTILETSAGCNRVVREMLIDCAYTREVVCGVRNSCEVANDTIKFILDKTLNEWDYKYTLSVKGPSDFITFFNESGCGPTSTAVSETAPFGTRFGTMYLSLRICR